MSLDRIDATKYPSCSGCSTHWRQSGNRTGHCSRCHRTFDGLSAFDRHWISRESGERTCVDPALVVSPSGDPVFSSRSSNGQGPDAGHVYWALIPSESTQAWLDAKRTARRGEEVRS